MAIKEHLTRNCEAVIFMISTSLDANPTDQLNAQLLLCFRQWIYHGDAKAMIKGNVLNNLFKVIDCGVLLAESLSIIGDLINFHTYRAPLSFGEPVGNKNIHSSDEINYERFIIPIIRKLVSLKPIYNQSVQNESIHITRAFAEILSQIAECYTPIIMDITKSENQQLLSFMIDVCSHPDKEMSELTFDAWSYLADHINDIIEEKGQLFQERFQQIYAKLLQILIQKSSYPSNNDSPSEELIEDISSYRNNVCDIIMACFETIQENPFVQYIDNLLRNECKTWQSYEVVIYVFRCIYQSIEEENHYVTSIISLSLTLPAHPIFSNTVLLMLEDYGGYIAEKNDLLQSSYQYIISLINHPETRSYALRTLYTFCAKYADKLYNNTETTLNTLENIFKSFKVGDQKNFVESILLLSSYITSDSQANNVFQRLLSPIIVNLNSTIIAEIPPNEKSLQLIDRLLVLESSLKIPEEYFHVFKDFTNNVLPLCERVHEFSITNRDLEVLEVVWKILWRIQMEMDKSAVNIEQLFTYLTADITTFHTLTTSSYETINLLTMTLATDPKYTTHFTNLFNVLSSSSLPIISNNDNHSIPVIDKYYRVLTKLLEVNANIFYNLKDVVLIVERSIISLLNIEKDSVQASLEFLDQLFIKSTPHETLFTNYSLHIISNLLAAIVNDSRQTLTVYLSKSLFDWSIFIKNSKKFT
ncbi:armadillo-like helical domain-containing protein [Heterostelium album PN500]|uniref:Armadillo-like helical domain-containing protein n=1 Tax=Heterostelium pallidum (strain ATCC 26659 / Pp 5 / PN500) TaxID=670386 RepID=D3BTS6_HETP5|nr:armadillo-like helical domain-containing protein [Heterostelium album PN500]EFA75112.1 armadillo-like helical domain-containing protein [Heterostelium album PN500]|eukprot:XP_020427246.1 armadillo-like helical domain-containing protein [Heterostelium album PN500]